MPLPPATAYHPLGIRLANRALPAVWATRLLPPPDLEESTLDAMATRATGLSDYGDDSEWRPRLRLLLDALREEANLNPLGRVIAHGSLLKLLKERLWSHALFAAHPEICARPLAAPVIVVGPMRSGTTRIHRLLAADPRFAHLRFYEAMCPVPWPSSRRRPAKDPRIAYTAHGLGFLEWVNPANAAVHPTAPLEADEELGLLEQSLWGAQIEAQRRVPAFARHCEAADGEPAYRHMADLLRLTGWFRGDDPARPWVLKTPQHMQDLAALAAVFPGARYIFTHRDPAAVVGSACSLAWHQMVVQSDHVDPRWIGAEWLHKTAHRIAVTARVRPGIAASHQLDVDFDEANADPLAVMRRVYAFLDLDLTPDVVSAQSAYLARAEREHGFRRHRYDLADFGLDAGSVRERLSGACRATPTTARPDAGDARGDSRRSGSS